MMMLHFHCHEILYSSRDVDKFFDFHDLEPKPYTHAFAKHRRPHKRHPRLN